MTASEQRRVTRAGWLTAAILSLLPLRAAATPSTVFWTPCSTDIQEWRTVHLTYDTYFTLGRKSPASGGAAFPVDLGLTLGILPSEKIRAEAGFDWLEPSDFPLVFNAKAGFPEGALFKGAPALEAGIFNVGTGRGSTGVNAVDLVTGKSLPRGLGRIHLGIYTGSKALLAGSSGRTENTGFMAAFDIPLLPSPSPGEAFHQLVLAADWMSGRNALGGGGFGVGWYLSKDVSVLTGPAWFNDPGINGDWLYSFQLDANL